MHSEFDSCTPDYVVYKETNVEKIGTIAGCRAVKFEEKAIKEGYRKLVVECVKEKEREGNDKTLVSDRERFYRENGYSSEGIKLLREREMNVECVVRERERERLGQWLEGKIAKTKYNERYKEIKVIGTPKYLRVKGVKGSQKLIARWRCGNEEEKNRYWLAEERGRCQICKEEVGSIEHLSIHVRGIKELKAAEILSKGGEEGGKLDERSKRVEREKEGRERRGW